MQSAEEAARDLQRRQLADFMKRKEAEVESLKGKLEGMQRAVEKGAAAAAVGLYKLHPWLERMARKRLVSTLEPIKRVSV